MAGSTKNHALMRQRILALEVRSARFGFAVLEGHTLLDWGIRTHERHLEVARKKAGTLLDLYSPASIVIRRRAKRPEDQLTEVIRSIQSEARRHHASVRRISADRVRAFFAEDAGGAKHDIAAIVAKRFSNLAWNLPSKRKPWQGEPHGMPVFDAIATAIAFSAREIQLGPFDGLSPGA